MQTAVTIMLVFTALQEQLVNTLVGLAGTFHDFETRPCYDFFFRDGIIDVLKDETLVLVPDLFVRQSRRLEFPVRP